MELNYSVLMAVYAKDNPEYLKSAIESMLHQTKEPEQFVLVIDGPISQNMEDIIANYSANNLFSIIRLRENQGLGIALNEGLKYCRNELVARMDADDISCPTRCEKELQCFEKESELVICGCNIDEFYGTEQNVCRSRIVPAEYKDILKFSKLRQPFNHPTVMYKKSKVLECGAYPSLKRKEDFDLFSRMLCNQYYASNIDESLYLYRIDNNNYVRRKSWVNTKSAICVYKNHLKRKGCTIIDFIIMCCAELLFYFAPIKLMKFVSDNLLRQKVRKQK